MPVLGWCLWWTISETEISKARLSAVIDYTIGSGYMPSDPRKKKALRRSLDRVLSKMEEGGLVRKIRDDHEMAAYALVREVADKENVDVDLEKENIVIYRKDTEELQFKMNNSNDAIRDLFEHYLTAFTDEDIRSVAVEFVKSNGGVTLKENGGVYFLPSKVDVDALTSFIQQTNIASHVDVLPIINSDQAKKQMLTIVKDELERDIQEAAEEVKRIAEAKFTKKNTLAGRLDQFNQIKKKCEIYSDLLMLDAEAMTSKVTALTTELYEAVAN
jgi:hypothetical protein